MSNPSSKGKNQKHSKHRKVASTSNDRSNSNTSRNDLIFGLHAIQAALEMPITRVTEVWVSEERHDDRIAAIVEAAKPHDISIHKVDSDQLDEMAPDARHQGGVARCTPLRDLDETDLDKILDDLKGNPFLLVLDGVQDPHNLGACMRSAEAAGAHAVIAPKDRASSLTSTALKVSSGAAERLPFIQVTNLARVLRDLQQRGIWVVGTSGESDVTLYKADLKGPLAIVLGAEGRGIRRLTRECCDHVMYIPMQGGAESLNVSVAAGVCLFEAFRQRNL